MYETSTVARDMVPSVCNTITENLDNVNATLAMAEAALHAIYERLTGNGECMGEKCKQPTSSLTGRVSDSLEYASRIGEIADRLGAAI